MPIFSKESANSSEQDPRRDSENIGGWNEENERGLYAGLGILLLGWRVDVGVCM
jgi:hypothetical protein